MQFGSAHEQAHLLQHAWGWPGPYIYGVYTVFLAGKLRYIYMGIYGVYIRFWPTANMQHVKVLSPPLQSAFTSSAFRPPDHSTWTCAESGLKPCGAIAALLPSG